VLPRYDGNFSGPLSLAFSYRYLSAAASWVLLASFLIKILELVFCPFQAEIDELIVNIITEEMHLQKRLSNFKDIHKTREKVICTSFVKHILVVCYQTRAIFCDYFKENVLLSIALKKPTLLKPSAEVVAIRSRQRLHFFNLDRGVSQLGSILLGSIKDQAVLCE